MSIKAIGSFILMSLLAGVAILAMDSSTLTIESAESKNVKMEPVFNEIRFLPGSKKDIWLMNQSHHGRNPEANQWDRLAIVIDKTKSPYAARFYQLKSGPLVWEEDLPQHRVEFSVSCMICHNNGPRAIRPIFKSKSAPLSVKEKITIMAWNLRIKTYGRIHYDPLHDEEDQFSKVPFRYKVPEATKELKVKTCVYCHNETGFLARGFLQRQQIMTIESLVSRGEMPPPGFSLSDQDTKDLQDFIRGF